MGIQREAMMAGSVEACLRKFSVVNLVSTRPGSEL